MLNDILDQDLYNHFIPVIWPANHMGSFLMNLLFDGEDREPNLVVMDPVTYEWHRRDSLHNVFGDVRLIYILASYIKKLRLTNHINESTVMRLAFNLTIKYDKKTLIQITDGSLDLSELLINDPISLLIERDSLFASFKYLKMHCYKPLESTNRTFNFSKKIFAYYPENKSWIPTILGWHKCHRDFRVREMHGDVAGHSFKEYKQNVLGSATDSDISIDMYNLVIQKNYNAILDVIPDFKFTNDKIRILEIAHDTTLEILNKFNMDHNLDIPMNLKYSEFLKTYNLDPHSSEIMR